MADIDQATQIGADGKRHPYDPEDGFEGPTDATDYRRGTARVLFNSDSFFEDNPILGDGEMVYTFDTTQMWVGDGETELGDLSPL